ncbi:MAG: MFS transporter [Microscillaceae bacterium]|jgi:maltose/moltooligosaccharide transporter|nr:MFS transporter [Microscillaceae bacterium]
MAVQLEKEITKVEKPNLSFWQLWNMNFGFLGIQFGFALQNANVSRIFETLGAKVDEIAILWIAAPTTGLLVQPIIGHFSDHTWHPRWGRRRPFFTLGAILASLALLIMPHSSALWMAAGMLWILDASINISMEPFRAFVGDMLPDRQRTVGFAMQTFFIGVGAVVASALPYILSNWVGMSSKAGAGEIPQTVIWSFYLGAIAFFGAVMWTVFNTKEYSPAEMEQFNGGAHTEESEGFAQIFTDFINMPATMRQLAFVQFFSWLALFAMWIYTTSAVTSHIFKATDTGSQAYNDGADWVGIMFATYNGLSALFAFLFPPFAMATSRKTAHMVGLLCGGLGLISIYFMPNKEMLLLSMVGVGFAWASILTMPYAILAGALPPNKMGIYMGIFNFFIVIPQIVAAAILGFVLKNFFGGEAIYAMIVGGISMLIAALLVVFVQDKDDKSII